MLCSDDRKFGIDRKVLFFEVKLRTEVVVF